MTDIAGLSNAITDVTVSVTDEELLLLGFIKGFSNTRAKVSYAEFLELIKDREKIYSPAGSPANVIFNAASLGLESCLYGTIGTDIHGDNYIRSLEKAHIGSAMTQLDGLSALSYILVTPDGEKSSITKMNVGSQYILDAQKIQDAKLFHTSGYELITNPIKTVEFIDYFKKKGSKISFDFADPKVIERERKSLEELLLLIDILFVTEEEAVSFSSNALEELSSIIPIVALKMGKKGSLVRQKKKQYDIPIYPVTVVNTNGAGDGYTAGFLYSYLKGESIEKCGSMGSYVAARVCAISKSHL